MINIICKNCKGSNLVFDANALWDINQQAFILDDTFTQYPLCSDCGNQTSTEEIETTVKTRTTIYP